jgi:LmbE family N-acetylglucosaminyl deacetylase
VLKPFTKADRVLILAPHPDDEVIACAGVIQEAVKAGSQVRVVYLTNGEHNQFAFIVYEKRIPMRQGEFVHMGKVRREESIKSMKLLGVNEDKLTFLGYPDFGTFTIFSQYWQTDKPYRTILTRISSVPYKEDSSFGSPYIGESILGDLKNILISYRPNKIFVSHPADVNGDHRALYLFLQVALLDLEKNIPAPAVRPYLVHCVGWPLPRHYHPELGLKAPEKILSALPEWLEFPLSKEQLNKKHDAILLHKSQTRSSAFYLLAFARKNELFSDYPEVELKKEDTFGGAPLKFSGFSEMYNGIADESDTADDIRKKDEGRVGFAKSGKSFFVRIEEEKGFSRKFSFALYLFGYSKKTPFANMPKIRILAKNKRFSVFNGRIIADQAEFLLRREEKAITLKVPLDALGDPDFIFASLKAYGGSLPMGVTGFRRIKIR